MQIKNSNFIMLKDMIRSDSESKYNVWKLNVKYFEEIKIMFQITLQENCIEM